MPVRAMRRAALPTFRLLRDVRSLLGINNPRSAKVVAHVALWGRPLNGRLLSAHKDRMDSAWYAGHNRRLTSAAPNISDVFRSPTRQAFSIQALCGDQHNHGPDSPCSD